MRWTAGVLACALTAAACAQGSDEVTLMPRREVAFAAAADPPLTSTIRPSGSTAVLPADDPGSIAVGPTGNLIIVDEPNDVVLTADGEVWERVSEPLGGAELVDVSWIEGWQAFVALSFDLGLTSDGPALGVWTSVDGREWEQLERITAGDGFSQIAAESVVDAGDEVAILGRVFGGATGEVRHQVWTSASGQAWATAPIPTSSDSGDIGAVTGLAWSGPGFTALGATSERPRTPLRLTSADGIEWEVAADPSRRPNAAQLTGSGGVLIAYGRPGAFVFGPGALAWQASDSARGVTDVVAIEGGWLAIGNGSTLYHSTDGHRWTEADYSRIVATS